MLLALNKLPRIGPKLDAICLEYHGIHENQGYDHHSNGESWLLQTLARRKLLTVCFDVGANHGDWTALVRAANPGASVHCFEVCPPTFEKLAARFSGQAGIHLNPAGLSDRAGAITVKYCLDGDGLSSMFEVVCSRNIRVIEANVIRGLDYSRDAGITKIDFLKIDVEGSEHLVLHGFGDLLEPRRIPIVQFEYGMVNISTKFLLRDFHLFFEARGYRVGKLFPTSVRFREYRFEDEDFRGPNNIAAAPELTALLGPG